MISPSRVERVHPMQVEAPGFAFEYKVVRTLAWLARRAWHSVASKASKGRRLQN